MSRMKEELEQARIAGGELAGGGLSATFVLPRTFVGFQGHFDHRPILPAVVQVAMAELLAKEALRREGGGAEALLTGVSRAKFKRPVEPGEAVEVCVSPGKGGTFKAEITAQGEAAAEFILSLVEQA